MGNRKLVAVNHSPNKLMQQAFRELLKGLLAKVGEEGLPGEHHFVITFDTRVPGVDMAGWMKAQYPEEMTIVMQHWFDNLAILDDRFAITLSFNGVGEPMVIPFNAIKTGTGARGQAGSRRRGEP